MTSDHSVSAPQWEVIVGFCPQIRAAVELANPACSSMWEWQRGVFAARPAVI